MVVPRALGVGDSPLRRLRYAFTPYANKDSSVGGKFRSRRPPKLRSVARRGEMSENYGPTASSRGTGEGSWR